MDKEEVAKIQDQLTNVRLDLRELSTKVDSFKDLTKKVDDAEDIAKQAMDSSKSAHHRLNKIDKLIFWLATTIIGSIILAIMGYATRGGFAPIK